MMSIRISVNNSPYAGKEGTLLTASAIKERLIKEAENDVALKVEFQEKGNKGESSFTIQGRGDLHLGVLIEKMRREGFEMQVTPPEVLLKEKNGKKQEPIEKVVIELDPVYSPLIIEKMSNRKATYEDCQEINPQKHK
jgi:GTP-binding protein